MQVKDIISVYEAFCPTSLSMKGDVFGLQFGSLEQEVKTVMISLDIREQTVDEAIEKGIDLIIVKHAPIFKPLKNFVVTPQSLIYQKLIKHDIAVYVSHTNIDVVDGGLNDWFCEKLGITDTEYLKETQEGYGIGRIGTISEQTFEEFASKVKSAFNLEHLRLIRYGQSNPLISRVAICGGSGDDFYQDALGKGAEVYITGDIYYHTAQEMLTNGLLAFDPGHYIEVLFIEKLCQKFEEWKQDMYWNIVIFPSQVSTNPFDVI